MDQISERPSLAPTVPLPVSADTLFPGNGEMAQLMRAMDWSQTALGPVETWSPGLRMMVRFLLANRFPLLLWWGPDFTQIYNDAYRPVLGTKHPQYLGQSVRECWSEIWDVIGPLIETPFNGGPATWSEDILLEINRHGFFEETHFTIAYSPVPDDTAPNGIGGVLATVHEISDKVVGERRVEVLRDLGATAAEAKTAEEACRIAAGTLSRHSKDLPFALLYLIAPDGKQAHLAAAAGVAMGAPISPRVVELATGHAPGMADGRGQVWPLAEAMRTETMQVVDDLAARFDTVPFGPWSDPPSKAVVVPIRSNIAHRLAGLLVAGVSSRLRFDDTYAGFFELVTGQLATAIANARAYEEERKRAEALAEIDRAKTAFFSNVSHEFRTPLTLLLGPLEDSLAEPEDAMPPHQRERLEVMRRNGIRLLKLVNTLLDFSRIEAGRVQASYERTDLAAYTAELASAFRSLIEKAGLALVVDCPPLADAGGNPPPVYVDREMWEKIVLNLLSNAFKFTFEGTIGVTLRLAGDGSAVELEVRDTGTGIPPDELPRLFERFHRIEGARARTYEGSGIGLALVQELVHLHGGAIRAESAEGKGTAFFVRLPVGAAHLPADRIHAPATLASTALGAAPFVEEARRWLPDAPPETGDQEAIIGWLHLDASPTLPAAESGDSFRRAHILLADDNADMRDYLRRLLGERYDVAAVPNGTAALVAARARPPDLILSDVMMPELDGFGLLQALRADPRTRPIPVILLSARAGDEAAVEGLQAGADDYLVKPFSAREVLARIASHLEIARLRQDAETRAQEQEATVEAITDAVFVYDREGHITHSNTAARTLFGLDVDSHYETRSPDERAALIHARDGQGQPIPVEESGLSRLLRGETLTGTDALDVRLRFADGRAVQINVSGAPLRDKTGDVIGAVAVARDVTEHRRQERAVRERAHQLEAIFEAVADGVVIYDENGSLVQWNAALAALFEFERMPDYAGLPVATRPARLRVRDEHGQPIPAEGLPFMRAVRGEVLTGTRAVDLTVTVPSGREKFVNVSAAPLRDDTGQAIGSVAVYRDITGRKRLERRTREALDALLELAAAMVSDPAEGIRIPQESVPGSARRADAALHRFAALCGRVLACEHIAFIAVEPGTGQLQAVAITGSSSEQEQRFRASFSGLRLADRFGAAVADQLLSGETVLINVASLRKDDPAHILSRRLFLIAPILAAGALYGYIGVNFGDEAEYYTAENRALALAVAQLAGVVMERTRLTHARAEAEAREEALAEANRRMDEFLGIASHELRTPLTSIQANIQLLKRLIGRLASPAPTSPSPVSERPWPEETPRERLAPLTALVERTERQMRRLNRLVGDLLDVTRIQGGKLEFMPEPCDLVEIVREAVDEQRAAWPSRVITLDTGQRRHLPLHADADRLGQVVTNYLTNALKYSPPDQPVAVRLYIQDDSVRVEVRDDGAGLSPEQQSHLFERFYRVPGVAQQSGSGIGLGLGLSICRTIIERHGGQVGVTSAPGKGSIFWFILPLTPLTPLEQLNEAAT